MNLRWKPPPLYFVHIPKTAGTSMEVLLEDAYGKELTFVPLRKLLDVDPGSLQKYRAWRSHCGPALMEFLPAGIRTITMLRDPVEQFISHLDHSRRILATPPEWVVPGSQDHLHGLEQASLEEWLDHPASAFFNEFQTQHLGAPLDLKPWFRGGAMALRGKTVAPTALPPTLQDNTNLEEVYKRACGQLEEMDVVGLTERFPESAELLHDLIGNRGSMTVPSENINPEKGKARTNYYRSRTSAATLRRIEERTNWDSRLYEYAARLFEKQRTNRSRTWSLSLQFGLAAAKRKPAK